MFVVELPVESVAGAGRKADCLAKWLVVEEEVLVVVVVRNGFVGTG